MAIIITLWEVLCVLKAICEYSGLYCTTYSGLNCTMDSGAKCTTFEMAFLD